MLSLGPFNGISAAEIGIISPIFDCTFIIFFIDKPLDELYYKGSITVI